MENKIQLARERLIGPLDNLNTLDELKDRVSELNDVYGLWKIGKGSFTRFGPEAVEAVKEIGGEVFLDLKYHDIPNTVGDAAYAAAGIGVKIFNVHAAGGIKMMEAAVRGAEQGAKASGNKKPLVIGVTLLTSLSYEDFVEICMDKDLGCTEDYVYSMATNCIKAGLDGIVCSGADLEGSKYQKGLNDLFKEAALLEVPELIPLPKNFIYVTPGIKGPNTEAGSDQKRVLTPGRAIELGASYLVCGRAITGHGTAEERLKAGQEVLEDMARYI